MNYTLIQLEIKSHHQIQKELFQGDIDNMADCQLAKRKPLLAHRHEYITNRQHFL